MELPKINHIKEKKVIQWFGVEGNRKIVKRTIALIIRKKRAGLSAAVD